MNANDCPLCHGRGATGDYADVPVVATVAQAALILDCSERHVRSLISSGRLGHCRLGRLVRIPRHQLLELIHADESGSAKDGAANTTTPDLPEGGRHVVR